MLRRCCRGVKRARDWLPRSSTGWRRCIPTVVPTSDRCWPYGWTARCTQPRTRVRKARNLEYNPRCAITVRSDNLDLVVEGDAAKVREDTTLQRVATAYGSKYDWPVTARDGALDAAYGAPTAGPPPYEVFGFGRRWSSASAPTTRSPPAPHAGGSEGPCLTWRPEFSIRCPSSPPRSRPRPRATPRTTRHRRSGRWCHLAPRRLRSDRAGGRYR